MGTLGTLALPRSKTFWLTFLLAFLAGTIFFTRASSVPPQPIAFNHHAHDAAGVGCADCHVGVQQQAQATLPDISVCLMCHESKVTESPEEEKIRQASVKGEPLVWQRGVRLPRHVYFSHRRHVALGKLECAVCHGKVAESTAPTNLPVTPLTMDGCMDCHTRNRVQNDCDECHR